jgi:hypothetical protein
LVSRFTQGDCATKRLILEIVGSNLVLTDKKLSIEARKPFRALSKIDSHTDLCATLKDIRILIETGDSETQSVITGIRKLITHGTPSDDLVH